MINSNEVGSKILIDSKVTQAEINFSGARISRKGRVTLKAGDNRLYLRVAAGSVSRESMTIEFDHTINSCSISGWEVITPEISDDEKLRVSELEKEIDSIEVKQSINSAQEEAYKKNSDFSSRNNVTVAESLEYIEKLPEILSEIAKKQEELSLQKEKLYKELDGINNAERKLVNYVQVDVNVLQDGEYEFTLHYYDSHVNWSPFYDIHADSLSAPLKFSFKGAVNQNTGEDWADVKIILICGNLSTSNDLPEMLPWFLDYNRPLPIAPIPQSTIEKLNNSDTVALMATPHAEKRILETMESYILPEKQVIRSGKNGSIVTITDISVPAEYIYSTVPKLDPSVFLTARIKDIGVYNLYKCKANIFLQGNYLGEIAIDTDPTKDYNELPLGRDSQIFVSRKNVRKYQEKHNHNHERLMYEYEIRIVNHKSEPALIQIHDQIPVSVNQEIKIENVDTSQGKVDPNTGEVTWFYLFQPDTQAVLKLSYGIVWPKGKYLGIKI